MVEAGATYGPGRGSGTESHRAASGRPSGHTRRNTPGCESFEHGSSRPPDTPPTGSWLRPTSPCRTRAPPRYRGPSLSRFGPCSELVWPHAAGAPACSADSERCWPVSTPALPSPSTPRSSTAGPGHTACRRPPAFDTARNGTVSRCLWMTGPRRRGPITPKTGRVSRPGASHPRCFLHPCWRPLKVGSC